MSPQERLHQLMLFKQSFLRKHIEDDLADLYYNDADRDEIMRLTNEMAEKAISRLAPRIHFSSANCVFCALNTTGIMAIAAKIDCDDCGYGKRHGICAEPFSDFKAVMEAFQVQAAAELPLDEQEKILRGEE